MKTIFVPVEVSDELYAQITNQALQSKQPKPLVTPAPTTTLPPRVVTQTVDRVSRLGKQLCVEYHMTFDEAGVRYPYWVPQQDEDYITKTVQAGKSYRITIEKTLTHTGAARYRWTNIEEVDLSLVGQHP